MSYKPIESLEDLKKGDTIRIHDDPHSYVVEQSVHELDEDEVNKSYIVAIRVLILTSHNGILKLNE